MKDNFDVESELMLAQSKLAFVNTAILQQESEWSLDAMSGLALILHSVQHSVDQVFEWYQNQPKQAEPEPITDSTN